MDLCIWLFPVKLPDGVSYKEAAGSLGPGLKAYTALHYHAHLTAGETVLVLDGAQPDQTPALQLARLWGAEV